MPQPKICPNCETLLEERDKFCSQCGQSRIPVRLPFLVYLKELVDSFFNFDNKFFSTLIKLIKTPGLVVREYNEDKKVRYVPPLRLYLFLSFFFFLLISSGVNDEVESIRTYLNEAKPSEVKSIQVTLFTYTEIPLDKAKVLFEKENITEAWVSDFLEKEKISTDLFNNKMLVRLVKLQRGEIKSEQVSQEFLSAVSFMVFLLMPIFALVLKICMGFRKIFYSEALVFSLYFHSLIGVIFLLGFAVSRFTASTLIPVWIGLGIFSYLVFYVKGAFEKSISQSIWVAFGVSILYFLVFFAAFIGAIVYSVIY